MKKSALVISVIFFAAFLALSSCTQEKTADPCDGYGVLNVENKLDSALTVKVLETHDTKSIAKDYTLPFTLAGNQPYTLTIDGPQYHKDTTIMLLFCDNKLLIVQN
jgi:invasion protein IalB